MNSTGFVAFPAGIQPESHERSSEQSLEVVVGDGSPETQAALQGFAQSIASQMSQGVVAFSTIGRLSGTGTGRFGQLPTVACEQLCSADRVRGGAGRGYRAVPAVELHAAGVSDDVPVLYGGVERGSDSAGTTVAYAGAAGVEWDAAGVGDRWVSSPGIAFRGE